MASDRGSESREAQLVMWLRGTLLVIVALGVTAAVLGTRTLQFFVIWFYLPVGWVYWRPRMAQILIWIMWSSTVLMLGILISLGTTPLLGSTSQRLMAAAFVFQIIALPWLRTRHKSPSLPRPSNLPQARVVK